MQILPFSSLIKTKKRNLTLCKLYFNLSDFYIKINSLLLPAGIEPATTP